MVLSCSYLTDWRKSRTYATRLPCFGGDWMLAAVMSQICLKPELVELMLGRKVERFYPPSTASGDQAGEVVCEVEGLKAPPRLRGIDIRIRRGEICRDRRNLQGQGQSDLFLALFGARRAGGKD